MPSSFGIRPTGPLGLFQHQKSKNPRSSTDTNIDPFGLLVFIKKMISRGETTLLVRDKAVINVCDITYQYLPSVGHFPGQICITCGDDEVTAYTSGDHE